MDRNPSPPLPSPDQDEEEGAGGDCIGSTVYSKHWLFGVLSGLIQVENVAPRVGSPTLPQPLSRLWQPLPATLPDDPSRGVALSVRAASTDSPDCGEPLPGAPQHRERGGRVGGMRECLQLKYFTFAYSPKMSDRDIVRFFAPHSHCRFRSSGPNIFRGLLL